VIVAAVGALADQIGLGGERVPTSSLASKSLP
jgi:hypothetical protein